MSTPTPTYFRDIPIIQAPILGVQEVGPLPRRLLLQVEDNLANAEVVEQIVERRSDWRLLTAIDGYQGIEMACSHQPDVILMDMRMPGINGHDAFVLLRNNPATAHIPVIALSSNAYQVEIRQCLNAGFFRYVTKPFKIVELMAVIDAAWDYAKSRQSSEVALGVRLPSLNLAITPTKATVPPRVSAMLTSSTLVGQYVGERT
jgi:CheY-like chemotaxis protein